MKSSFRSVRACVWGNVRLKYDARAVQRLICLYGLYGVHLVVDGKTVQTGCAALKFSVVATHVKRLCNHFTTESLSVFQSLLQGRR